jgi:hypothetical protein
MIDPEQLQHQASYIVLHAWVATYRAAARDGSSPDPAAFSAQLQTQAGKLRDSAVALQAALEKMRIANERLAARMAAHKAFFAKYKPAE